MILKQNEEPVINTNRLVRSAISHVWVALNEYREELIPSNCDDETNQCRDYIWDELCASMNIIERSVVDDIETE